MSTNTEATTASSSQRIVKDQVCWLQPWLLPNIRYAGKQVVIERQIAKEVDGVPLYKAVLLPTSTLQNTRQLFVRQDELWLEGEPPSDLINPRRLVRTLRRMEFAPFQLDGEPSDSCPEYIYVLGRRIDRQDSPTLLWCRQKDVPRNKALSFFSARDKQDPRTFRLYSLTAPQIASRHRGELVPAKEGWRALACLEPGA